MAPRKLFWGVLVAPLFLRGRVSGFWARVLGVRGGFWAGRVIPPLGGFAPQDSAPGFRPQDYPRDNGGIIPPGFRPLGFLPLGFSPWEIPPPAMAGFAPRGIAPLSPPQDSAPGFRPPWAFAPRPRGVKSRGFRGAAPPWGEVPEIAPRNNAPLGAGGRFCEGAPPCGPFKPRPGRGYFSASRHHAPREGGFQPRVAPRKGGAWGPARKIP